MKNLCKFAVFAIFGLFFFINIITLNDGHNWGDDFAQYIQHAVNLVEHKPYASGISYDLWIIYPPGYPLILSSVIYWFGVNFKIFKFLNVLFWALGALAAYGLAFMSLDLFWARVITVWILTSPLFFTFKQSVLSDIPFMCFVLMSLWAFMRYEECLLKGFCKTSRTFLFLSIFCMSYAFLIRWAGISLLMAAILYFSVIKRDWKGSLGFILGTVISWYISFLCGSSAGGYFDSSTVAILQNCFWVSWHNLTYTFQSILNLYILDENFLSKMITPSILPIINSIVGLMFLSVLGSFIFRLYKRKLSFMACFTFFYLFGIVFWPIHAGTRFLLPIMVPITIYLIKCIKPVWRSLAVIIFMILIIQNVYVIASEFNFNDDDIFKRESLEMMQWVEAHIKPDENYMFSKPRALGLLTHRVGHSFWTYQKDLKDWYKRIKPLHIKYLIADKRFDQFSLYNNFSLRVDNYELYIKTIWENNIYKIFKVTLTVTNAPVPARLENK